MDPNAAGLGSAVSCGSSSFCVAVDEKGYVVLYNGKSWSTPRLLDVDLDLDSVCVPRQASAWRWITGGSPLSTTEPTGPNRRPRLIPTRRWRRCRVSLELLCRCRRLGNAVYYGPSGLEHYLCPPGLPTASSRPCRATRPASVRRPTSTATQQSILAAAPGQPHNTSMTTSWPLCRAGPRRVAQRWTTEPATSSDTPMSVGVRLTPWTRATTASMRSRVIQKAFRGLGLRG